MDGFDPAFTTPEQYILDITYEIWEGRGLSTLHRYYAPDVIVRAPAGVVTGNEDVIAATMATLAEFPDRQLLGEDIIWCDDGDGGFLSSHRIISTATHAGDGKYGVASGTRLQYRIIAECAARSNQIYDEWIIRDQGAIVRQLGIHPKDFATLQLGADPGGQSASGLNPWVDPPIRYSGKGNTEKPGMDYAHILDSLMAADFTVIGSDYDRAVQTELPGGVTGHGRSDIESFWMGLRSALPDAQFRIHHQIGRVDPEMPPRAALRWSLVGTHSGWGTFGPPSGAPLVVVGLSHAEFGPYGLRREWVLVDETAVWQQILAHQG